MSSEFLIELWSEIKPFISSKERLDAADKIVSLFDENGMLDGIEDKWGLDRTLLASLQTHLGFDDGDENEEE